MTGGHGSSADVEIHIHISPNPADPPAVALAIAMRESAGWCGHVDDVRRNHYQRWAQTARR